MRTLIPPAAALAAGAALLGPALWAAGPVGAATNPACPDASASTATSCTYAYTGAEQAFTVPSGVTGVTVNAVGAPGGAGNSDIGAGAAGGFGAAVTATVPVSAGATLYVEVGGPGTAGGFNGGGNPGSGFLGSGWGGTGGGASDVRTTSISTVSDSQLTTANDSRLAVAGGGGGGGGYECGGLGGTAGDPTATAAGNGGTGTIYEPCVGATAGSNGGLGGTAGGVGGAGSGFFTCHGGSGLLGQGGDAPSCDDYGSGGGGGYYGGGGGGAGASGGGGGGAGSSFWVTGATGTSMTEDTTGTPEVVISWTPPAADLSLANAGSPNPVISGQPLTYTLTATNTGGQDATGVTVTDPLPASAVFGSMTASQGTCTRTVTAPNKNKDGTVTCSLGTLPSGATATVTITVTPTTKGTLASTAAVTASNVTTDGDDSATAAVIVHGT